jgi:aryl-alcohol dehydrogenase-like predicted oxidoreductase
VSVEKIEEALKAIEYPSVATVQIIFNIFRQRPAGLFFEQARLRDVGLIIRVPLASGLLTGKFTKDSSFAPDDHRSFNRHGEQFDVGETFAGVDYATGVDAADELKAFVPDGASLTQLALRWILDHDAVSTVIAGAKTSAQVRDNAAASELAPLPTSTHEATVNRCGQPRTRDQWITGGTRCMRRVRRSRFPSARPRPRLRLPAQRPSGRGGACGRHGDGERPGRFDTAARTA